MRSSWIDRNKEIAGFATKDNGRGPEYEEYEDFWGVKAEELKEKFKQIRGIE